MNCGLLKNKEGWCYRSANGIQYEIYEGMSMDGEQRYRSDIAFIMLLPNDETGEFEDKFGVGGYLVDWLCGATFIGNDKEYETVIRNVVEKFEESHREVIDYLKEQNYIKGLAERLKIISENDWESLISPLENYIEDIKENPTSVIEFLLDQVEAALI